MSGHALVVGGGRRRGYARRPRYDVARRGDGSVFSRRYIASLRAPPPPPPSAIAPAGRRNACSDAAAFP